ncbi:MAG: hypothetical protein ABW321_14490 [Polyangiales bacterium]
MHIPQDRLFREQRERYRLQFTCERCAQFDDVGEKCAHGYPTTQHRDAYYADESAPLVFCKHFEIA